VKLTIILSVIVACLALGYLSLSGTARERVAGLFSLNHEIRVEVARAHKRTVGESLTARGELLPLKEVRVNSTFSGVVKEMRFAVGDRVAKGAMVAVLEATDLAERLAAQEAAIKDAEQQVKKSQSRLVAAEKQLSATRELLQKELIARREAELAEATVVTARAQKEAAEAQFAQRLSLAAQTRHVLGLTRVTAPVSGFVSRRWVEPGARVDEAAPLVSISEADTLKIVAHVKSAETEKLAPGSATKVLVDAMPQRVFRGRVTQVQELGNFSGDQSSVEIVIPNPNNVLKIGMTATAALALGEVRDGMFIPATAILQNQVGPSHVFVIENGKARRKEVVLGKQQDDEIEVVSGLRPDASVVVKGNERLHDGSRVLAVQ
jgi:RND family efflux transporter MFP subunit